MAWTRFARSSNPGIRRPRRGGVVEGVAITATPSRTTGECRLEGIDPATEMSGIGVTDAHLCGY
jgi:hypothetical protein